MKFLVTQLTYLMTERESRRNLRTLAKFVVLLTVVVAAFSVIFHAIMVYEGQNHSWLTGVYWTLTVMSTLGFGDITFHSDLGRMFSIVVLITGIVLLLVVLPFAFIKFFYAPWLDAQMRAGAPRSVPSGTRGHVIICRWDEIGKGLAERLTDLGVAYHVIEPDPVVANDMKRERVPVVCGERDSRDFYVALAVKDAALVVANLDDVTNTNITLTVREECPDVRIVALAEELDSVDILELSGATQVLPLKHRLAQHLASRVSVGTPRPYIVGHFHDVCLAEFSVRGTPFAGRTVRDSRLRELTGLSVVAFWERGKVRPAGVDAPMGENTVAVVVGSEDQLTVLEAMLSIYPANENPVVVLGGGKVGREVARALQDRDVCVHVVERNERLKRGLEGVADRVFYGDASAIGVVTDAGVKDAPAVVLTTHDDATNIYLAVYCRRLNPTARIISRITQPHNMEAIHRAGADFVLSYTHLGIKSLEAAFQNREEVVVVVGLDLFVLDVPSALFGKSVADAAIGADTGLNIVAIQQADGNDIMPTGKTVLAEGARLVVLGSSEQRHEFERRYRNG